MQMLFSSATQAWARERAVAVATSARARRLLAVLLIAVAGCTGAPAEEPSDAAPTGRPNVLWLTAEDMSAHLGAWGDAYAATPHLDALAADGVRYTNAFATAPVCSPARSTLITGVYAVSMGTHGLRSHLPIPETFHGFPSYLREAGYYTTNNVKTDYNTSDELRLIEESWDESSPEAHWRGRAAGQPFFAVFNFMHTHQSRTSFLDASFPELVGRLGRHDPAEAPVPPFYPDGPAVRRTLARYYDAITAMDEDVGAILAQLEEDGLADETIVFFFSDHGMGLPRGKRVLYDSGLHVPLVVRFPEKYRHLAPVAPGGTTDRLVSFVDFAPTVLRLAGLPPPAYAQGEAFLGPDAGPPRSYVFGARDRVDEAYELSRSVRDDRYLYLRHYYPHYSWNQPEFYSDQAPIRQEITRLAREGRLGPGTMTYAGPGKPREELFDAQTDPHQLVNLADDPAHRDVRDRLRARLVAWQRETHDLGFLPEAALARRTDDGTTPWELARDADAYDQERLREVAGLVGLPGAVDRQVRLLQDPDPAVRYWAAVGLRAAGDAAGHAGGALEDALDDPSPDVRIQAAGALAERGPHSRAVAVLSEALVGGEPLVVLRAARTLQQIGEHARPARAAMEQVLAAAADDASYGGYALYIRFSLEPALAALDP